MTNQSRKQNSSTNFDLLSQIRKTQTKVVRMIAERVRLCIVETVRS